MDLQTLWFLLVAVLFAGYFLLEGFDFGVGMLLPFVGGKDKKEKAERRTAAVGTIAPVWDGNEVWLITAAGALFAAFPVWYATMFSGYYLPMLLILLTLIVRGVGLEWRSKVETQKWRNLCDTGTIIGSYGPALLWGVIFTSILRGAPIDEHAQLDGSFTAISTWLSPVTLLGGLGFVLLFMLHGAMFLGFKAAEPLRTRMHSLGLKFLAVPAIIFLLAYGLWIQFSYQKTFGWGILIAIVVFALVALVMLIARRDGWAFAATCLTILATVAMIFASLFPLIMPSSLADGLSLDIYNSSSSDYTLTIMSWAALIMVPLILIYQGWSYWVFRKRVKVESHPPEEALKKSATAQVF